MPDNQAITSIETFIKRFTDVLYIKLPCRFILFFLGFKIIEKILNLTVIVINTPYSLWHFFFFAK